jgi:very-short-patch-repair endonuclease
LLKARGSDGGSGASAPFEFNLKRKTFFTKSELAFHHNLLSVLEGQPYAIFPKVRLADLFIAYEESRQTAFNKISRKHVDCVIVAMPEGVSLVGIELDGPSHENERQQAHDADKDAAFKAAGLPLLRVATNRLNDLDGLLAALSPHLTLETRSGQQRVAEPVRANARR